MRRIGSCTARTRSRQRNAIITALTANFLAAMWASKGDTTPANLRDIRDRFLADIIRVPPPK